MDETVSPCPERHLLSRYEDKCCAELGVAYITVKATDLDSSYHERPAYMLGEMLVRDHLVKEGWRSVFGAGPFKPILRLINYEITAKRYGCSTPLWQQQRFLRLSELEREVEFRRDIETYTPEEETFVCDFVSKLTPEKLISQLASHNDNVFTDTASMIHGSWELTKIIDAVALYSLSRRSELQGSTTGWFDLTLFRDGQLRFVEVKRGRDTMRGCQVNFAYYIARPLGWRCELWRVDEERASKLETPDEQEARLKKERERQCTARANETTMQYEARLKRQREYQRRYRALNQTPLAEDY